MDRRSFILSLAKGVTLSSVAGIIWGGYISNAKANGVFLRPPFALNENEFLQKCLRCGLCVESCPYDTLKLANFLDEATLGTPFFEPRLTPCYMCDDIPCSFACPSGALDRDFIDKKDLTIDDSKMGIAYVDSTSCIAFWGIQCDACHRACPLIDKALVLKYERNERTGKHALLMPVVDSDYCTGCGKCENACVTKKPAIFVLPPSFKGEVSDRYIKGWDSQDDKRLENISSEVETKTGITTKSASDYLNRGSLLDE